MKLRLEILEIAVVLFMLLFSKKDRDPLLMNQIVLVSLIYNDDERNSTNQMVVSFVFIDIQTFPRVVL